MSRLASGATKQDILDEIKTIFVDHFELEDGDVVPSARLGEDLDLDSIDAVDLAVTLKERTGERLDPEVFKQVRTVGDVVDAVHALLSR